MLEGCEPLTGDGVERLALKTQQRTASDECGLALVLGQLQKSASVLVAFIVAKT